MTSNTQRPSLWYDMLHVFHTGDDMHPEHPDRVRAIVKRLRRRMKGLLTWNVLHEEFTTSACRAKGTEIEEHGGHDENYEENPYNEGGPSATQWQLTADGDTYITDYTTTLCERAQWILSNAIESIVYDGQQCTFVCIRPPGHHASSTGRPSGFCHLNNAWVAVEEFHRRRIRSIGILDWDVHHGDGTEECMHTHSRRIPGVRFASIHAFGDGVYPGTGASGQNGNVLNVGLPSHTRADTYMHMFRTRVMPFLGRPDVLIVSAGYDAHYRDPMQLMKLRTSTYRQMSEAVKQIGCPVLFLLEGGYAPEVLAECVEETLGPWVED